MSVSISISKVNFGRLQRLAEPLVDTLDDVLGRLIDRWDAFSTQPHEPVYTAQNREPSGSDYASRHLGKSPLPSIGNRAPTSNFDPESPPDLTHTKLILARYDGKEIDRPKWSRLMVAAVGNAKTKLGSIDAVSRMSAVQMVAGEKAGAGFIHYSDIDVSIQGQDTDKLWKAVRAIAHRMRCPVEVEFEWQDKPGAAFPWKVGRMEISPL